MKTENLKVHRARKNMSQQQLAEAVGVTQVAISRYEKEPATIQNASYKRVMKIAEVLDVEPNKIEMGN